MLRRFAFGSMCLGLVALATAITCAVQADEPLPGLVLEADAVVVEAGSAVEAQAVLVLDGGAPVTGTVLIESDDGQSQTTKIDRFISDPVKATLLRTDQVIVFGDEDVRVNAASGQRLVVPFLGAAAINDPAVRETLEKLIANLKEQAEDQKRAGKEDEAWRKMQAIEALHMVLSGGPKAGVSFVKRLPSGEEFKLQREIELGDKAIKERMIKGLTEEIAKSEALRGKADEHPRLKQRIADLHAQLRKLNQQHDQADRSPEQTYIVTSEDGVTRHGPGERQDVIKFNVQHQPHAGGRFFEARIAPFHGKAAEMLRKAEALQQAAGKLKEAGLEDQARVMDEQSQQMRQTAEKMMVEAAAHPVGSHAIAIHGAFPGAPHELHKALTELREQVQELRKEVGQLRELLEKKQ